MAWTTFEIPLRMNLQMKMSLNLKVIMLKLMKMEIVVKMLWFSKEER